MLHFCRYLHQLQCKCCREISLLLPRRLGSSWTATRCWAPIPPTRVLANTDLGLLPGARPQLRLHEFWPTQSSEGLLWRDLRAKHGSTIFEHKPQQARSSKALLWRDFRAYHASTIFEHNLQITSTKKAQERAQFLSTIYKSRAQKKHKNEHNFEHNSQITSTKKAQEWAQF